MAQYLNIHTHKIKKEGIELVNTASYNEINNDGSFSFGLHPWNIEKDDAEKTIEQLKKLCEDKKIIAVGEIGLDRAIKTPLGIQQKLFLSQVEIAVEFDLPAIIHSVRANSDLIQVYKHLKTNKPWVFHGFRGSLQEARQIIDIQCYLSFGKALIYHEKTQKVLQNVSLDQVFFETDDSDEKISTIYKKAAELLDICIEKLKEKIYSNFTRVFGL